MKRSVKTAGILVLAILLVSCGGASSGKALAQEAIKAIRAQDQEKLETVAERFDELGPAQKVRFGAELAKHGEEIQEAMQEIIKINMPQ